MTKKKKPIENPNPDGLPVVYTETVDHPAHYNMGGVEVIDAIEAWDLGFNLGNAVKYIARAEHKGKHDEDLEKALWYLTRELERRKRRRGVCE